MGGLCLDFAYAVPFKSRGSFWVGEVSNSRAVAECIIILFNCPVSVCVCFLLLQDLLQSCSRGGRRRVEDMCYERRRAEACVDESAHHALVGTREEPGTLSQRAPVFPGSSRLGIEPETPGWLVHDPGR